MSTLVTFKERWGLNNKKTRYMASKDSEFLDFAWENRKFYVKVGVEVDISVHSWYRYKRGQWQELDPFTMYLTRDKWYKIDEAQNGHIVTGFACEWTLTKVYIFICILFTTIYTI